MQEDAKILPFIHLLVLHWKKLASRFAVKRYKEQCLQEEIASWSMKNDEFHFEFSDVGWMEECFLNIWHQISLVKGKESSRLATSLSQMCGCVPKDFIILFHFVFNTNILENRNTTCCFFKTSCTAASFLFPSQYFDAYKKRTKANKEKMRKKFQIKDLKLDDYYSHLFYIYNFILHDM